MINAIADHIKVILIIRDAIILVGLIGNCLSFIVFSRKTFAKSSIAFYCKCLAIFDSFMIVQLIIDLAVLATGLDLIRTTFGCKLIFLTTTWLSPIPNRILMFFAIDQMLAALRYKHIEILRKRKFQLGIIVFTILLHTILYLPMPILFEVTKAKVIEVENATYLESKCDVYMRMTRPFTFMYFFESILLPFVVMMITTSVILKCLYDSRRNLTSRSRRGESSIEDMGGQVRKRRERKFGKNCVMLNVIFILLTSPLLVSAMFLNNNRDFRMICLVLFYFNYSIHFWTHLFVNSIFRKEFLTLIGCLNNKASRGNGGGGYEIQNQNNV
jgi:hypothetical protein